MAQIRTLDTRPSEHGCRAVYDGLAATRWSPGMGLILPEGGTNGASHKPSLFPSPCEPHARRTGHARYPADSHSHSRGPLGWPPPLSHQGWEEAETAWHARGHPLGAILIRPFAIVVLVASSDASCQLMGIGIGRRPRPFLHGSPWGPLFVRTIYAEPYTLLVIRDTKRIGLAWLNGNIRVSSCGGIVSSYELLVEDHSLALTNLKPNAPNWCIILESLSGIISADYHLEEI